MSRRVYVAWRSATAFLQGCPAGRSSWGLAEASVSIPEQPTLERAQRRNLFSTLEGSAEQADVKIREEGDVCKEGTCLVTSFIASYFAAKKKYPSLSLVVRETGEVKKRVKNILDAFKNGQNALLSEEAYVEDSGVTEESSLHASEEVHMEGSGDMASGDATYLASLWSKDSTQHGVADKFEPLASTLHAMASKKAYIEGSGDMASRDSTYSTREPLWKDLTRHGVADESNLLASTVGTGEDEALLNRRKTKEIYSIAEVLRENNNADTSDQEFLELLEQANSKENVIKKTTPLIEVLQQTASGSRRVHLSTAWRGPKKDMSWNNTIRSIMPSSIEKRLQNVINDSASSKLSSFTEIGKDATSTLSSTLSTSREKGKDSHATGEVAYAVKLISTKRGTVLNQFNSANLVAELKRTSRAFSDLQINVRRVQCKGFPIHAILYFKTFKGMLEALKLKTVVLQGETLILESGTEVAVEDNSLQELGAGSFSKEDFFMHSFREGLQVSHVSAEGQSLSSLADDTFVSNQSHLLSSPNFLQTTITIEDFPIEIPLKSIHDFFSVFGALQIFYGKGVIFIKFENECDKKKALKVHQFLVDGFRFQIRTDVSSSEVVIRLVTEEAKVDTKKAINACSKYGSVTHFQYHKTGELHAHYGVSELGRVKEILSSLGRDKDLKGIWKSTLACEGFKSCSKDTNDEEIRRLLDLSRRLLNQVEKMYSERNYVMYQTA